MNKSQSKRNVYDLPIGYLYSDMFCTTLPNDDENAVKWERFCYCCLGIEHFVKECPLRVGDGRWCTVCKSTKHWTSTCNKVRRRKKLELDWVFYVIYVLNVSTFGIFIP
mmetsp:Transcript_31534/g.40547  ORF Transcript_31534/g.40547 Transcript_31534/m.40547 type:complete len:109 (+) Transcript_31534:1519-1845(+)